MATFGKNIFDSLTTGMYADSKVIYREYIQNACDQIDKAIKLGIIDKEEASIDILINEKDRYICIKDNATGIKKEQFKTNLGDIANSNKKIGQNKGFRGIGRLCGLAYCTTLKFTASYKGENTASIMTCDAKQMRDMLYDEKKYSVDEIWEKIVRFDFIDEDIDEHYFKVELININKENTTLLNVDEICDYLSFIAPVPYKNTFYYLAEKIYQYAKRLNYTLDEYNIYINGRQIFKEYTTRLKVKVGNNLENYDEISNVAFHEYYNEDKLLAWSWIGLSRFEKSIPKENKMRGLRLRSANIQIGNDDTLKKFFKEDRGNYYFVGEVFAIDKNLIPNAQRNYFNENETRVIFENEIKKYFIDELHKLYTIGNRLNNIYKHEISYSEKVSEYETKFKRKDFASENEKKQLEVEIDKLEKKVKDDKKILDKYATMDKNNPLAIINKNIEKKYSNDKRIKKSTDNNLSIIKKDKKEKPYIPQQFSRLSRNERKIVGKILTIITDNTTKEVAQVVINKIKEEFK